MPRTAWPAMVGDEFQYTVQPGDFLYRIGARFGEEAIVLARQNRLDLNALIHPGQKLAINNRHIVPGILDEGILINIPQRMLFLFRAGRLVAHYPVGLGRPDWPTPVGHFRIRSRERNKTWVVPESIQEEMREKNLPVQTRVEPGPDNPLGEYWMGLAPGLYGLHSTIAPPSIYDFRSHGCVRLHPDDAADLFSQVRVGDSVEFIYQPILLERTADGAVWLEVHPDPYERMADYASELEDVLDHAGLAGQIDAAQLADMLKRREGMAQPISQPDGR